MAALDDATAGDEPLAFFSKWFEEARTSQISEVNAMTVATADEHGRPHARIVLLKGVDDKGFLFFTNYDSAKGHDLAVNPYASLVFFWKELERQVRIEGAVEKISAEESDDYFNSRPEGSRIGTWASPQSSIIAHRDFLDKNYQHFKLQFIAHIPRPAWWGGYRILAQRIEFWQGRSNRMHDRIVFYKHQEYGWIKQRLAP